MCTSNRETLQNKIWKKHSPERFCAGGREEHTHTPQTPDLDLYLYFQKRITFVRERGENKFPGEILRRGERGSTHTTTNPDLDLYLDLRK